MSRCIAACMIAVVLLKETTPARGDVTVPPVFGDFMVLQMGHELPFWGEAEPGEEVSVTIANTEPTSGQKPETVSTMTGADGRWRLKMPPRGASGKVEVTISGKNSLSLTHVLIGDVWLCSGQSNMDWPVSASLNHQDEIADARFPAIRYFKLERSTARTPHAHVDGRWIEISPESVGDSSAVSYFFGRELFRQLDRPIGLIQAASGGAGCEAWISHSALKSDDAFAKILERADRAINDPNQANNPNRASVLFNGMIAPIQPFSIKGVIWYQGESNAPRAFQYRKLFPVLINDWRKGWGQGDFPFLYVQLANYLPDKNKPDHPAEPEESLWAELREAQSMALTAPKTGMVVTIDIGEARDIHPKNKQAVGKRLALAALRSAYSLDVVASGPEFHSMKIVGHEIHLEFQHVGGGLVAHGETLKGFAISGADKKFVWAHAKIDGEQVIVSAPGITDPVDVRYAWADNPDCNLYNKAGLPASPFRTDDWPSISHKNE